MSRARAFTLRVRAAAAGEAGFGMVEVMVSMVLLTALSLATLSIIDKSQAVSATGRSKAVAASLAHDDLNRLRQLKFSLASSANYQSQTTTPPIDKVKYTVASSVTWATDTGVETTCTTPQTGGNTTYLRIRSTVTWPGMGKTAPVVADSIMAPRGKEANRTAGSLMVTVQDRDGKPVSGATVVVNGQTLMTSATGCVFFPQLAAGQWPVYASKSGVPFNFYGTDYVTPPDFVSPGTTNASVVAGDVSTATIAIDQAVVFDPVKFTREDGTSSGVTWPTISAAAKTKTVSYPGNKTGKLFPFADGWSLYAGNCAGNNPGTWATNTSAMPNTVWATPPAPRNQTINNGQAYLRNVTMQVRDTNTETLTFRIKAYTDATYAQMGDCNETYSNTVKINTANTDTQFSFDVPYGLYSVCAENGSGYNTNSYRVGFYDSGVATKPPTPAIHVMPSMSGVTLKGSSPKNDALTAASLPTTISVKKPSTTPASDPC